MLDFNPLSVTSFANKYFLPFSLFLLSMVSFAVQNLVSLISPFCLFLLLFSLGDGSENIAVIYAKECFVCFLLGVL